MSKPRLSPFEKALVAVDALTPDEKTCLGVLLKPYSAGQPLPPKNEATPLGTARKRVNKDKSAPTPETPVGQ